MLPFWAVTHVQLVAVLYVGKVVCVCSDCEVYFLFPGISMAEAKRMGGGRHVCPFPREFGFPVPKGDQWDDLYDLIRWV